MVEKDSAATQKAREKAVAAKKAALEAKAAKAAGPSMAVSDGREVPHEVPRLKKHYAQRVVPALMESWKWKNPFQAPKLSKIVVNMGVSEARENIQALDAAREELAMISGQWPQLRRAGKSISNFKLRQGMPIGLRVTLRGDRMYEFLDRLITMAIPRIRDFRGLETKGFDGNGNYNLGLREQMIFPEVNVEKSPKQRGMNISIVTNARQDSLSLDLLKALGMPFKTEAALASSRPEESTLETRTKRPMRS
jgi:large subunit ribosomal protein L5